MNATATAQSGDDFDAINGPAAPDPGPPIFPPGYVMRDDSLFYEPAGDDAGGEASYPIRLSGAFDVLATTRDEGGGGCPCGDAGHRRYAVDRRAAQNAANIGLRAVMLLQLAYVFALGTAGFQALRLGDEALVRTFALLVLNFLGGQIIAANACGIDMVKQLALLDFVTALTVLFPRTTRAQVWIGELFFVQIGLHFAFYRIAAPDVLRFDYFAALNFVGWGQIAALWFGTRNDAGKRVGLAGRIRRHAGNHPRDDRARKGAQR